MFDKYVKVNEKKIVAGQTSAGVWYCKEVVCETSEELKKMIADINSILNSFNNKVDKTKK